VSNVVGIKLQVLSKIRRLAVCPPCRYPTCLNIDCHREKGIISRNFSPSWFMIDKTGPNAMSGDMDKYDPRKNAAVKWYAGSQARSVMESLNIVRLIV
jgi:hypothetical protein